MSHLSRVALVGLALLGLVQTVEAADGTPFFAFRFFASGMFVNGFWGPDAGGAPPPVTGGPQRPIWRRRRSEVDPVPPVAAAPAHAPLELSLTREVTP